MGNNECGHCINGVENNWDENPYTGCDCLNTGHWGWHCELDNKLLCEHVDRDDRWKKDPVPGLVSAQLKKEECGECRGHYDCKGNATCKYQLIDGHPQNYCECPTGFTGNNCETVISGCLTLTPVLL